MKTQRDERHTAPRHYYNETDPHRQGRLTEWHVPGEVPALTEWHTPECETAYRDALGRAFDADGGIIRSCTCDGSPAAPPSITFGSP